MKRAKALSEFFENLTIFHTTVNIKSISKLPCKNKKNIIYNFSQRRAMSYDPRIPNGMAAVIKKE